MIERRARERTVTNLSVESGSQFVHEEVGCDGSEYVEAGDVAGQAERVGKDGKPRSTGKKLPVEPDAAPPDSFDDLQLSPDELICLKIFMLHEKGWSWGGLSKVLEMPRQSVCSKGRDQADRILGRLGDRAGPILAKLESELEAVGRGE